MYYFSNICIILKMLLVIHVVIVESNFFKLKSLKSYLILTMLKDKLNAFVILYIVSKRLKILNNLKLIKE